MSPDSHSISDSDSVMLSKAKPKTKLIVGQFRNCKC